MASRHLDNIHRIFLAAIISLTIFLPSNQTANYDGYKVYRLYPDTSEKIAVLKSLLGATGYDFWQEPRGNTSKLMVAPNEQKKFEELMDSAKIIKDIVIDDVAAKMERDSSNQGNGTLSGRRSSSSPTNWRHFSFDRYLRYDEMLEFAETLASNKSTTKFFTFGKTSEGRKMFGVKLSTSEKNPVILIDGGIHAREWAAPMSVLYVLKRLIEDDRVLKNITFYIVPLVNPDGYEHTHEKDRLWRKTRSKHPLTKCLGTDANRNFDSHWNEFGTESEPCSSIYSGPKAFSEPETRALRDLMKTIKPTMYLTFHTYGGLILYPWGFTSDLPPNGKELDSLGKKAAAEVERIFKTKYVVGSSTNVLYPASGGSDDWSMEKAGVPLVFCIELEDYGSNFQLPAKRLKEIVKHAETIVRVFIKHVVENYMS